MLILEGAQAGLSWITLLRKRDAYRKAFDEFDPEKIAKYRSAKIESLLKNPGIVRNRLKVQSTVTNAQALLEIVESEGSFDSYIWSFIGNSPRINRFKTLKDIPAKTTESEAMSKDLKRRGFKFIGSTICYAFMQAVGMVNDHTTDCFRHNQLRSK